MMLLLLCISSLLTAQSINSSAIAEDALRLRIVAPVPKILKEASGLELTPSGLLWTHNDDRFPIIYGLDTTGNIIKTIHLNHRNKGWEDLTQDNEGNLYIGAFGNNGNDRRDLEILRIPPPDAISDAVINAALITFRYPDQNEFPATDQKKNFDADAFVSIGDSLYIFSKNRTRPFTGYSKVYRLPSKPGDYEAVLHDSLFLGSDGMLDWVTSADISADGQSLVLLSHDCIWLITNFPNQRFSGGTLIKYKLNNFSHKAGVCFDSRNALYIIDELEFGFLGGKVYVLDLPKHLPNARKATDNPK